MNSQDGSVLLAGQRYPVSTEVIDLVNTRLVSFAPLAELPELRVLRLHHTDPHSSPGGALLDLLALRKCPNLSIIEIPRQNLRTLDGLEGHNSLQAIDVSYTRINDLQPLAALPNLAVLKLRHTRVTSLEPLASIPTLEELDIAHTGVADLGALKWLPALTVLDLRATCVTDLSVLADMPALRRVVVQRLNLDGQAVYRLRQARPGIEVLA